jgi:YgiT-type zinc finger domain-containing protein
MAGSATHLAQDWTCPHCLTGTLRLKRVVFAAWHGGQFVTLPNFPGWVCDLCGEAEYDALALEQVLAVLGPEAALRRESARLARPSPRLARWAPRPSGRRWS